jgi:hypothetical protein
MHHLLGIHISHGLVVRILAFGAGGLGSNPGGWHGRRKMTEEN